MFPLVEIADGTVRLRVSEGTINVRAAGGGRLRGEWVDLIEQQTHIGIGTDIRLDFRRSRFIDVELRGFQGGVGRLEFFFYLFPSKSGLSEGSGGAQSREQDYHARAPPKRRPKKELQERGKPEHVNA